MRAIALQREADFHYFTSDKTRQLIKDEGVEIIGFRELRDLMRGELRPLPGSGRVRG